MFHEFPISAVTDEFSSEDFETAASSMRELGMSAAELRVIFGKNIIDLSDAEIDRIRCIAAHYGLSIISIASPVLKCELPDAPPIDSSIQHDVFGVQYSVADQSRLAQRAFEIARKTGAKIIRVFSYWRTIAPEECFERVVTALRDLAEKAARNDLIIGLENEHACNIATAAESARVLKAIDHPNFKLIWDPANAYVSGERAYPDGYGLLPVDRIVHVHAKDCTVRNHQPIWGALGEGDIGWKEQIEALRRDGYRGYISLETHWRGPSGDKHEASMICGRNLRTLATSAQRNLA
jgi:sugar phosphate isomerase/epimerase